MSVARGSVGRVLRSLFDVVFPLRCAGCGAGPWPFCPACRVELAVAAPPMCERCGRPFPEAVPTCRDCPPPSIATARAPFLFRGPVRSALYRLKFSGWRAVAEALGAAMAEVNEFPAAAVTWVPLAGRRRAVRGYDQARALAVVVARRLGTPAIPMLARTRETGPQARRGGAERRTALRGAFVPVGRGRSPPRDVLLVDDVLTTGATAAECADVLRRAGAARVGLLTAARSVSGPVPAHCYAAEARPARAGRVVESRPSLWLPGDPPR